MTKITTTFHITGMTCDACQKLVQKRLSKIAQGSVITVDKDAGVAEIMADRVITSTEVVIALEGTAYSL